LFLPHSGLGTHKEPQFAKAAGATVIATTSSQAKAEVLKKLGADHVINYKEDESWGKTARSLTYNGQGVDHIIEVGGAGTLEQSLAAIRFEGVISIIGFLGGAKPKSTILDCLNNICTTRGVYVGSKAMMEEMVAAIESNNIHPVVDKTVFSFDKARDAYEYMVSPYIQKTRVTFADIQLSTVEPITLWQGCHQDRVTGVGFDHG
jgi:NADPH:quinone reductase-like Zn-dependent oxidoreductase